MNIIKRHLNVDIESPNLESVVKFLAELEERGFIKEGMLIYPSNKENEVQQIFIKHNLSF